MNDLISQPHNKLIGALLIGGQSQRMGQPKCLLPKAGTTLGAFLWNLLTECFGHPPILVGDGPLDPIMQNSLQIPDAGNFCGPVAGILGLHQHFPNRPFVVFAVDLYFMEAPALHWLSRQIASHPGKAIWPKLPGRPFGEPLASVYPPAARNLMAEAATKGETALHRALPPNARLEPQIPLNLQRCFTNVNRPEDLPQPSPGP